MTATSEKRALKAWAAFSATGLMLLLGILFLHPDLRGWTPPKWSDPAITVEPVRVSDTPFSVDDCLPGTIDAHSLPSTQDYDGTATEALLTQTPSMKPVSSRCAVATKRQGTVKFGMRRAARPRRSTEGIMQGSLDRLIAVFRLDGGCPSEQDKIKMLLGARPVGPRPNNRRTRRLSTIAKGFSHGNADGMLDQNPTWKVGANPPGFSGLWPLAAGRASGAFVRRKIRRIHCYRSL